MMRPETEVPSDFQDYTLVTVVSVAAHLSGHELGDKVWVLYQGLGTPALCAAQRAKHRLVTRIFEQGRQDIPHGCDVSGHELGDKVLVSLTRNITTSDDTGTTEFCLSV